MFTVMCRLDLCVILLVLTQVSAIHDSDRHSRNGAHSAADELMRRDSPKVRRSPSQEDADPDEIAQQEAPKQVVRDLLSTAQESRDREAFEAALRDGERIGLDEAELQAFKESFENPQKHYSDSSGAEALIDEQDILQSLQSGSSDSAKSLQTAQAPEDDALGPLLSEAEKEEEKTEKTETGDHGAKDKGGDRLHRMYHTSMERRRLDMRGSCRRSRYSNLRRCTKQDQKEAPRRRCLYSRMS